MKSSDFFITTLCSWTTAKYSSQNIFENHRIIATMFVVALIIYGAAIWIEEKLKARQSNYKKIAGDFRLLAYLFLIILLVLILVPLFGWLLLSLWTCLFICLVCNSYQELCQFPRQAFNELRSLGNELQARRLTGVLGTENSITQQSNHHQPVTINETPRTSVVDVDEGT